MRRVIVAFLVLVALAGILAISSTADDGNGAPDHQESTADAGR